MTHRARALLVFALLLTTPGAVRAADPDSTTTPKGTQPFSDEADVQYKKKHIFPLFADKLKPEHGRKLPPPYGVMFLGNWLDSDWDFVSAEVALGGSAPITIDAADDATMDLNVSTVGFKGDIWVLPFLNVFVNAGQVDVDANLSLRDIPLAVKPGGIGDPIEYVKGDAIVPMTFDGTYYAFGLVPAGAWKHFYGAADMSWAKTNLSGSGASLSTDGFWTFTIAPKIGYNAGLSQIYIGARYISKNEHYTGTVDLPSGNPMSFDVYITTDSWAPNAGMRTIIQDHWEIIMEVASGVRHQITTGIGYRW